MTDSQRIETSLRRLAEVEAAREAVHRQLAAANMDLCAARQALQRSFSDVSVEYIPDEVEASLVVDGDFKMVLRDSACNPLHWFCRSPQYDLTKAQQGFRATVAACMELARLQTALLTALRDT